MWPWLAVLASAGLLVHHFSASAASNPDDEIRAAVAAALAQETDPSVLQLFARKLRAAGFDAEAEQIDARSRALGGASVLPASSGFKVPSLAAHPMGRAPVPTSAPTKSASGIPLTGGGLRL